MHMKALPVARDDASLNFRLWWRCTQGCSQGKRVGGTTAEKLVPAKTLVYELCSSSSSCLCAHEIQFEFEFVEFVEFAELPLCS
jgi:hypothetical protein